MSTKPFEKFGLYIKGLREQSGLTLRQVSTFLNMTHTQDLSAIENGSILPRIEYQKPFCKLFKIDFVKFNLEINRLRDERGMIMARKRKKKVKEEAKQLKVQVSSEE